MRPGRARDRGSVTPRRPSRPASIAILTCAGACVTLAPLHAALRNPRFWLGLAISVAALYFAVRGVDWAEMRRALAAAAYGWLLPSAVVICAGQVARAVRWRVLFGDAPRPELRDAFAILSVGYLVSAIFPLRLGDPIRAWLVDTHTPARGAEAFGTVMVERAVDLLTVLALLAVVAPVAAGRLIGGQLGSGPWSAPASLGAMTFGLVVAVYAGMLALSSIGGHAGRAATTTLRRLGLSDGAAARVGGAVAGFAAGVGTLRRPRVAAATIALSVLIWWPGGLQVWFVMEAFHLDLSLAAALFVLCGTAVFAILPSSPGYVGVFHSAVVLTLSIIAGIPKAVALSYAVVLHGLTILVLILLGLVGLRMIGLSGSELGARLDRAGGAV